MNLREQIVREIEQTPEALLEEVLDFFLFLKQRKTKEASTQAAPLPPSLKEAFTQLRQLCVEENYTFETPLRQNRPNPFDENLV
jgi:hypothetical protein